MVPVSFSIPIPRNAKPKRTRRNQVMIRRVLPVVSDFIVISIKERGGTVDVKS
jgi:hypothetical protein